jgi:MFS family permease
MLTNFKFSREVNFLFLSILLFATAIGIDVVTFPTILSENKINPFVIGVAATFEIIGGIFASFFLSRIVAKIGMMSALRISAFSYAIAVSLIYFYQNIFLWIAFIFFMGCCWFIYVISRQAWFNIILKNEQRAIATGIFSMAISAGIALGPVIVSFSGAHNYISFLISAALVLLSYFCISKIKNSAPPKITSEKIPLKTFFKNNPRCFMTRFFLDFQTYCVLTFTVIFGVRTGLSYESAGLLVTSYMASGFFDVWVGFVLKKTSPYKMINIGFLGCIYIFLTITLYHNSYILLLILYFIFGLSIACIYVSVFKIANEDYPREQLVAANSTFQIIGSIGSLFGSLIGGLFLNLFDANGFLIAMILSSVFYLTFLVTYEKKYSKKN